MALLPDYRDAVSFWRYGCLDMAPTTARTFCANRSSDTACMAGQDSFVNVSRTLSDAGALIAGNAQPVRCPSAMYCPDSPGADNWAIPASFV
jgi:hypothetical protein